MTNHPTAKCQDAVVYTRYSSHSQRDVSIEQQLRECQRFAQRNGLQIVSTYEDRALSGTNDQRPGFQKMMKDAEHASWSYIIVYALDRFARNRYDSAVNKRKLKDYGIKVLSAMENISDDPTGILMESVLEGLAEYYSMELSQKIRRGMADNASKCMVNGSLPLGYVRGPDGRYAIEESEAQIVRDIYQRVKDGERICDIIHSLNLRGILTKTGKPWNKSSFNRLLSNERYTGVYIYGETRIPGGIPQIISNDLFDSVQYAVQTKKNPRTSSNPQRRRRENGLYLLTGKLFCGRCKSPMVGVSGKSKHGRPYFYYVCKTKRFEHTCEKQNVPREQIELFIATALKEAMFTDDAIFALADAAIEYQKQSSANAEVESLRMQLSDVEKSIKNLISAMEAGIFSAATQSRLTELEYQKRTLSSQLSIAMKDAEGLLTREQIIATLKLFQNGDVTDKSYQEALIDTFLVAAYVYDDHVDFVFNLGGKKKDTSLPFSIEDISFSDTCTENPSLHQ